VDKRFRVYPTKLVNYSSQLRTFFNSKGFTRKKTIDLDELKIFDFNHFSKTEFENLLKKKVVQSQSFIVPAI
jgi:hypothetical protein